MGTGFNKRKKQARQMQEQLMRMQEEMKNTKITGTAGNGLVSLTINGDHELIDLKIKPDCVDPEDVEGLEDLIKAAFADAAEKLKETSGSMMPPGGMPPGMPDLGGLF